MLTIGDAYCWPFDRADSYDADEPQDMISEIRRLEQIAEAAGWPYRTAKRWGMFVHFSPGIDHGRWSYDPPEPAECEVIEAWIEGDGKAVTVDLDWLKAWHLLVEEVALDDDMICDMAEHEHEEIQAWG